MFATIRQWVIKTMMKGQTGVVRTLPKNDLIELNTQITAERMMRNGINPEDMKTVGQVENVIEQIDTPKVNVNPGITGVKKADVLDMEGNKIPEGSKIMGGKQVESDAAIKARLDASNQKGIAGIKNNRMLDEDEIAELDMDIGGLEYTNDFDGTLGSANKLRKERADYIAEMELEYKKGNLDPKPGEANRERFLQQKFDEMEASGDNRLMTRDEVEELSSFDLQRDMDKSVEKFKKKDAKQKKTLKDFDPEDRDPSADGGRIGLKSGAGKAFIEFLKNAGKTMNDKSPVQAYKDYLKSVKDRAQKGDMKTLAPEMGIIAGGGILTNRFLKKKLGKMNEAVEAEVNKAAEAEVENKADGGRIGLKAGMTKRAFLKLMGASVAGVGAAKSGIFSLGKGATKQAAKEVAQQTTSSMPPPYFFKLAEKIKKMGTDTTPTNDRTLAKSLLSKDGQSEYILEESLTSGDTLIKKVYKEEDMITNVEIMSLKKGEDVVTKNGKPVRTPDEYEEVTETNSRVYKDEFNDPDYEDGINVDEIIKEVDDQAPPIKYASGGLAYMLGE